MRLLRTVVCLVLLVTTSLSYAQFSESRNSWSKKSISGDLNVGYQGEYNIGFMVGNGNILTFGTTQGVKIGQYVFTGLSLNAEMDLDYTEYWNIAPLATFRAYYPLNDSLRMFLSPEFGVSIGVAGDWNDDTVFEYRLTTGFEYKAFQLGIGCGGFGCTAFFVKLGVVL